MYQPVDGLTLFVLFVLVVILLDSTRLLIKNLSGAKFMKNPLIGLPVSLVLIVLLELALEDYSFIVEVPLVLIYPFLLYREFSSRKGGDN